MIIYKRIRDVKLLTIYWKKHNYIKMINKKLNNNFSLMIKKYSIKNKKDNTYSKKNDNIENIDNNNTNIENADDNDIKNDNGDNIENDNIENADDNDIKNDNGDNIENDNIENADDNDIKNDNDDNIENDNIDNKKETIKSSDILSIIYERALKNLFNSNINKICTLISIICLSPYLIIIALLFGIEIKYIFITFILFGMAYIVFFVLGLGYLLINSK